MKNDKHTASESKGERGGGGGGGVRGGESKTWSEER